jgi:hypothetical protein
MTAPFVIPEKDDLLEVEGADVIDVVDEEGTEGEAETSAWEVIRKQSIQTVVGAD